MINCFLTEQPGQLIQQGKDSFSTNGARISGYPYGKNNESWKMNWKNNELTTDLHVQAKTIKVLEESILYSEC